MEETSAVVGGVTWELLFFARSFFLGFCLRMVYDLFLLLRRLMKHGRLLTAVEDFIFWLSGSVCMFGLMFRENNGTPRLFAIAGLLLGMLLYHLGPSPLICGIFDRVLSLFASCRKIIGKNVEEVLKRAKKRSKIEKKEFPGSEQGGKQGNF